MSGCLVLETALKLGQTPQVQGGDRQTNRFNHHQAGNGLWVYYPFPNRMQLTKQRLEPNRING